MTNTNFKKSWRSQLAIGQTSLLAVAVLSILGIGLSGCHGGGSTVVVGGGGGSGSYYVPPQAITQAWYDVYGNYCGSGSPAPGCNFYSNGAQVIDIEDPYFSSTWNLQYGTYYYYDSYGYSQAYTGWGWQSPTGVLYDDYGYALNQSGDDSGRDVVGDVADKEEQAVLSVGKSFAEKNALAESTGVEIARTLRDFAVLGKSRARTDEDVNEFTKRLYGVNPSEAAQAVQKAMKDGDKSALDSLNEQVSNYWGTTPGTSKKILKGWFKSQLSGLNVE